MCHAVQLLTAYLNHKDVVATILFGGQAVYVFENSAPKFKLSHGRFCVVY